MNANRTPPPACCLDDQSTGRATSPSRRRFLKETLLGLAVLHAARLVPGALSRCLTSGGPAVRLRFFSEHEYMIMRAVAARIVGAAEVTSTGENVIDPALRADEFLSLADTEIQEQFHQLLTVFNGPVFAFLFDFRFSSFLDMNPEDQESYLEDWMTSPLTFRRQAFMALKRLSLSMYYTDHRSWEDIRYSGLFLPWERL